MLALEAMIGFFMNQVAEYKCTFARKDKEGKEHDEMGDLDSVECI